jgi:hypothetical protein
MSTKKMTEHTDHNALLLQVMAHDLLAPLTAIKWQIELLNSNFKDVEKKERYMKGIADSTELGISLTKHAHVAGKVLSRSYSGDFEKNKLSRVISDTVSDLKHQYERHGLILEENIDGESAEIDIDVELTKLFVWSLAKFFLTCVPPQTVVKMEGFQTFEQPLEGNYVFTMSAKGVQNGQEYVQFISAHEPKGNLDQTYVFAELLYELTPLLNVTLVPSFESDTFTLTASF